MNWGFVLHSRRKTPRHVKGLIFIKKFLRGAVSLIKREVLIDTRFEIV